MIIIILFNAHSCIAISAELRLSALSIKMNACLPSCNDFSTPQEMTRNLNRFAFFLQVGDQSVISHLFAMLRATVDGATFELGLIEEIFFNYSHRSGLLITIMTFLSAFLGLFGPILQTIWMVHRTALITKFWLKD
jgi:hypothetical protein